MSTLAPLGVRDIAAECRRRARMDTTENMTAIVLLLAAKAVERLADRVVLQAHAAEQREAARS